FTMTGSSTYQTATYQPQVYYSSTNAHSGSYSLRLYGVSYTCLPPMAEPLNGLQLTFNTYTTSTSYKLAVGVMEGNTFVPIDTLTTPTSAHTPCTVYFGGYTGTSRVIAFRNYNTSATSYTSTHYIDDVAVDYLPACSPVTGLTASTTSSSITLSWADYLNNGATYTVSDASGVIATGLTATTYTVTGLAANTEYTYTVTANCSATENGDPVTINTRTDCGLQSLPYTTGFEDNELQGTTNLLRLPWCSYRYYVLGTNSSYNYYPYSYSSSTYAHTGSRSLYFYGATSTAYPDSMTFILPAVDVQNYPMNGNRLRFYARSSSASYNKVVYIGTLTDPTDPSTYSPVGQVTVTGTTHNLYEVSLTSATATAPYVCLTVLRGSGSLYLDDLSLEEMPSCMDVSNLAVSAVTSNSITLTWADTQNPSATYTVSDTSGVIASGINAMTYTVTGLSANTEYTFNVVANCTADNASPATSVTGRTACAAFDAPYTWNFEDMTANAAPLCWTKVGTGTINVLSNTSNAHNSTMYLRFSGETSNLILLPQTEDEINTLQVRFWTRPESFTNASCGTFSVGYVTDASNANTFVALATYTYNEFSAYDEKTVIFSGAPTGARMAMRHNPTSTSWYWYVDDVTIEDLPSCVPVTALTATPASNSVTLSWTDAANTGATYTVSDGSSVIATGITGTTYTVTGLTSLTDYTFYVTANCSADVASTAVSVAVRTLCNAVSVPFVENFDTYTTSTTAATGVQVPCWTLAHKDVSWTATTYDPQIYYST
ncbi:MAG: fibronectin type III domain-containing protein, partial [Bacteroidales bacterium]|nr:fibronectin type III domain-containing protein [Bacteroidales bacterium]